MNAESEAAKFAIERVVIALAAACDCVRQIEAAADLAESLHAELHGVFIEDADLLKVADLPFTCQVTYGRATAMPLERASVEAEFRALANQARRCLERAAAKRRIAWSFDVSSGQKAQHKPPSGTKELLVMETRSRAFAGRVRLPVGEGSVAGLGAGSAARAFLGGAPAASRHIAVFLDDSPSSSRALAVAVDLAGKDARFMHLFRAPGASGKTESASAKGQGLPPAGLLPEAGPKALRQALRACAAGIAVLPVTLAGGDPALFEDLIGDPPCTILIVE